MKAVTDDVSLLTANDEDDDDDDDADEDAAEAEAAAAVVVVVVAVDSAASAVDEAECDEYRCCSASCVAVGLSIE